MQVEAQKNEKITVVTMSVDFVDEKIRISNPTKEGYLDKLSSFWKTYRKRWMVVQGYTLYTFKEEKDYENPTEIFDLRIYNKVVPSANGETGQFELSSPNDTRTFLASSENEMKDWIKHIQDATGNSKKKSSKKNRSEYSSPRDTGNTSTLECGCSISNIRSCPSARIIKILLIRLDKWKNAPNSDNEPQSDLTKTIYRNKSEIVQSLHSLFQKHDYSVTKLMDDLHHLKYEHNIDRDDMLFDSAYEFFKESMNENECDIEHCPFFERHHRERGSSEDDHKEQELDDLLMDTVSMIYCYFLYSYDTQRFSKEERQRIMKTAGILSWNDVTDAIDGDDIDNIEATLSNGGIRPLSASMSSSADAHSQPHGRTLSALSNTSALSTGSGGTVSAANTGNTAATALPAPSSSARGRRGGGGVGGGVGSSSEALFEGTLYKRGRYNKAFKERWFVISRRGQWMEYYESRERAQCNGQSLGTIDLALVGRIEAFTVDPSADPDYLPEHIGWRLKQSETTAFSFCVHSVHRELHLAAINEVDLLRVLHYLDIAVYGGVVKAGWLRKQEGATAISRKWKRRYGVLNEYGQLKWYKDEDRTKYLGFIDIDTLSSVSNGKRSATLFQLDLYTKYGNVWCIGCDEESDRKSWNHHITALLPDHHPMGHTLYSETSFTSSMVMTTPNEPHSDDSDEKEESVDVSVMRMITGILTEKRKRARGRRRFRDDENEDEEKSDNTETVNFAAMSQVIGVEESVLQKSFNEYKEDRNLLIADLIDVVYGEDAEEMDIWNAIEMENEDKNTVFQQALHGHFNCVQLDVPNLVKLCVHIIARKRLQIDIEGMTNMLTTNAIDGRMFDKADAEHYQKNGTFSNRFKAVPDCKVQHVRQLYTAVRKWKYVEVKKVAVESKEEEIEDTVEDDVEEQTNSDQPDVYAIGKRFNFWQRKHNDYVQAKYKDLKEEMLQSSFLSVHFQGIKGWNALMKKVEAMIATKAALKIKSNGSAKYLYRIEKDNPFDSKHLCGLKLYTDYTNLCAAFCTVLRRGDKAEIAEIVNLARTLSETIQCYGTSLSEESSKKTYYRGVNRTFMFMTIVSRFNLPQSTTSSVEYTENICPFYMSDLEIFRDFA